jgi:endogenous inhibitor of DNA gyrase (YacG/DUF329 family)
MATEYRPSTPPDNDIQSCPHCGVEFTGSGHKGYCSKSCYNYDIE